MDEKRIFQICNQTRKDIIENKEKTILFREFPYGCCRDASIILGLRLVENSFKDIKYCYKDIDDHFPSHAWLHYNEYVIDITADQFGDHFQFISKKDMLTNNLYQNYTEQNFKPIIAGMDLVAIYKDINIISSFKL